MIDRNVLQFSFTLDEFPTLKCPRCQNGVLNHSFGPEQTQPSYSSKAREHPDWEPDWQEFRLAGILACSDPTCGEVVVYSADGTCDWDVNVYGEQVYDHFFRFRSIHPAPWIIDLPRNIPAAIKQALLASFDVYWNNKQLCANAIRQAIEVLLDHHQVDRLSQKGKRLALAARIDNLEQTNPEFSELLGLFRPLLNAGSHGETVDPETLLNVLEALEIHLHQAFDEKPNRLSELKRLLKES